MIQSFYSAKLGISAQQTRLYTIANNIANINTEGFRSSSVTFKDALYTAKGNGTSHGTGAVVAATSKSFKQGTPIDTGVSLDFTIDGTGFFTIERSDGIQAYTRAGSFAVSAQRDGNYLMTANGNYVLDADSQRIRIPNGTDDITVDTDGTLRTGEGVAFAKLGIACFFNQYGLSSAGDNCFTETVASGQAKNATYATVINGVLEGSNVDFTQEMGKLIRTQRAYSIAGKALQAVDEMHQTANNMRV